MQYLLVVASMQYQASHSFHIPQHQAKHFSSALEWQRYHYQFLPYHLQKQLCKDPSIEIIQFNITYEIMLG